MTLSIGIIGLPNVGKSTVFNALTGAQIAEVANYPFCTINPNRAIVPLRDPRLDKLKILTSVDKIIYATIEFVDIAGLVQGASKGEGLGNQFLSHVRNTDALVHIIRGFDDPNVVHVHGQLEPISDIEIINIELALADLAQLEKKISNLESDIKGDKSLIPTMELARALKDHLALGNSAVSFAEAGSALFQNFNQEMRFLTAKPVIYIVNIDETGLLGENSLVSTVQGISSETGSDLIVLCGKLEEEMVDMNPDEKQEFLELTGVQASGLDQIVGFGFKTLGLINFFTKNENEVRAWTIPSGTKAPQAAGRIHTDFERGFIRAEVVTFDDYSEFGSDTALRSAGLMRSEGKEYVVSDGDVILFRFNI